MAYFAVYELETGVIQNIVECPEFLSKNVHYEDGQAILEIEQQISQLDYLILNKKLVEKN